MAQPGSQMPPTGPGTGRAAPPPMPKSGGRTLPVILGLGLALGAGYYLMNPSAAQHDSEKIKQTSQSYGNKFDKVVDDAVAQAKTYGKDAEQDLKKSYEDIKAKAGNLTVDAEKELKKKFEDTKAGLNKTGEEAKAQTKKGWFS